MDKVKSFFDYIKVVLKDVLEKYVVQKFFHGTLGGIKGWFTKHVLKYFNKKVLDPSIDYLKRQYRKLKNKKKSKDHIEAIKGAEDEDSLSDSFHNLP